jgi:hypothetical protein
VFRHVVVLRWTAEATDEQRSHVMSGLAELPGLIPELRDYRFGPDAHMSEGNFDLAIVADFDDVDGYLAYRDNPDHVSLINERIRPILADRAAVQHEIEG